MAYPRSRRVVDQKIYDSRVQHLGIDSHALGTEKYLYVYTPPDLTPGSRAPVLYLLRGHEREWINCEQDKSRGTTNVIDVYERLRAARRIDPMILVFPSMSSDDNKIPGLLVNMRDPAPAAEQHYGIGKGQFADYFFDEIVPFIDSQFPTLARREGRALAGFSLGGAMSVGAAARRPDLFCSASAYDGTFLYAAGRGARVRSHDRVIENPMFDPAYGQPRDMTFVAATSASNCILRGDGAALANVTWLIGYGPRRHEPWQANYYRGEHLVRCLQARGIQNGMPPREVFGDGDHTWRTADLFMEMALPLHDAAFVRG